MKCKRKMQHVNKIKARWAAENATVKTGGYSGTVARQGCTTLACITGGGFAGSIPMPQFLNIGSQPITAGSDKQPTLTVDEILLKNPGFNPFLVGFDGKLDDYRGSFVEAMDVEFRKLYESLGIDIDFYARQGLPNPITLDQVPKEFHARLALAGSQSEIRFFINRLQRATGNELATGNRLNYEPNYVYSLMVSFPDVLVESVTMYNTETEDVLNDIMNEIVGPEP